MWLKVVDKKSIGSYTSPFITYPTTDNEMIHTTGMVSGMYPNLTPTSAQCYFCKQPGTCVRMYAALAQPFVTLCATCESVG